MHRCHHLRINIQPNYHRAVGQQCLAACLAYTTIGTCHEGDLAQMWFARVFAFTQFSLLQYPVFKFKNVFFWKGFPATQRFACLDCPARMSGDIGGYIAFARCVAKSNRAVIAPDTTRGVGSSICSPWLLWRRKYCLYSFTNVFTSGTPGPNKSFLKA